MSFIFNYITYNHIILLIIIYNLKIINALALWLKKRLFQLFIKTKFDILRYSVYSVFLCMCMYYTGMYVCVVNYRCSIYGITILMT